MMIVRCTVILVIVILSSCTRPPANSGQNPQGAGSTQGSGRVGGSTNDPAGRNAGDPAAVAMSRGNQVFINSGCLGCHKVGDEGGSIGPDLSHIGATLTKDQMKAIIKDPKSVNPNSVMPAVALSDQDLSDLVDYLATLM
jgi:mono/diheme cytochrome c family protein